MKEKKEKRFEVVYQEGSELTRSSTILVDKVTGIQYLFLKSGYGAGLTPLLGPDGQPMKYHPPVEESWK